ncbi:MAG: Chemotaxis response regulator protein-glutamate methylesterase CheB [Labilithrix sp.]|nr:Chemotaxis response regulator protein-glutamate methylesterase CheB [Labilithrix sp.]
MKRKVRALVVDSSALVRQLLTQLLSADPDIEVVGTAPDAAIARAKIAALTPDVLTLDVDMPKDDGFTFLRELTSARPVPVVIISSLSEEHHARAIELGALDFVTRPKLDMQRALVELGSDIVAKVKAAARSSTCRPPPPSGTRPVPPRTARAIPKVIVIGASTGGTEALRAVLTALPANAPPVVVVQHMPANFTRQFAERLDGLCKVRVKEAEDGDALVSGQVLIAPGGDAHLEIVRSGLGYGIRLIKGPPVGHHRPSVDVMFSSCARVAGPNAVAAILTGMGSDGAKGMLEMRRAGATTMAEDESTCVVFGMPKEALLGGGAEQAVPLDRIASALLRAAQ